MTLPLARCGARWPLRRGRQAGAEPIGLRGRTVRPHRRGFYVVVHAQIHSGDCLPADQFIPSL